METVMFALGAALVLAFGSTVVLARSPLRGALALIATLCSLAALYAQLDAGFVAAMQVLVYAGAIMVLFLFVIMLLNLGTDDLSRPIYASLARLLGVGAGLFVTLRLVGAALVRPEPAPSLNRSLDGSVRAIGQLLTTDAVFVFEAISVLLLVAVVGAVVLGFRRTA